MATKKKTSELKSIDPCFATRQERFAAMCEAERYSDRPAEGTGIGTYKEKRLHALLKDFYTPERARQEVRLEEDMINSAYADLTDAATRRARDRYVADILTNEGEIIEIQTGGLFPLTKKLHFYLCATNLRVTVVHPICAIKHMRWMDPETGELSPPRRSPKRGRARDVAKELYWLLPYLAEPRLKLIIALIDVEEVSPHYMMIVDRVNNLDMLEIQVELNGAFYTDEIRRLEEITKKIGHIVQQAIGLSAKIKIVEPRTLVRSEGKAVHVIDKRKLV
jgi:hypothetical protein